MNFYEKIVYLLQTEMETPKAFGWFHIMCIILTITMIITLYKRKNKHNEKQLKLVLGVYGIIALLLELAKQISWSFNYDELTNIITWDYEWYSFPFQLCTTPIFISLICLFLKDNKIRKALLSYMSFVTILGSIVTIVMPDSCFVSDILVNIHTMWLHCGSLVVSIYLLVSSEVEITGKNLKNSLIVFLIFVLLAETLNISIYQSGILNGETFNMFYISPYFTSTLPVFDILQQALPFMIYLLIYISVIATGALIIYYLATVLKSKKI